jgi:hypothetical protein
VRDGAEDPADWARASAAAPVASAGWI